MPGFDAPGFAYHLKSHISLLCNADALISLHKQFCVSFACHKDLLDISQSSQRDHAHPINNRYRIDTSDICHLDKKTNGLRQRILATEKDSFGFAKLQLKLKSSCIRLQPDQRQNHTLERGSFYVKSSQPPRILCFLPQILTLKFITMLTFQHDVCEQFTSSAHLGFCDKRTGH